MRATFKEERVGVLAIVALLSVAAFAGPAEARKLTGSGKGEWIVGTQGSDRIKGLGGGDRLKGRGGKDTLIGGKGRDVVVGGKGRDKHKGGPGADLLKAADGRVDRKVSGGPGFDRCVVAGVAELAIARSCEKVNVAPLGGGGGGAPPLAGLVVRSVDGLLCDTPLPVCVFSISGTGAQAPVGTATGGGGVVAAGAGVSVSGTQWTATGLLGCAADGYIHIVIGPDVVDVPVDCSLSL